MYVIKDLTGGPKPEAMEMFYNGTVAADSVTKRYKGSLVKVMDHDTAAGRQLTWAGGTTLYESLFGILEEEQGITGNYEMNDADFGARTRMVMPVLPSTMVRAEYAQNDSAGSDMTYTGGTISAGGKTFTTTATEIDANDLLIGGWMYFINGANAGYLHYIIDAATTTDIVFSTAVVNSVVGADNQIVVLSPHTYKMQLDDHEVNIVSNPNATDQTFPMVGIKTWFTDMSNGLTMLKRSEHDGLKLKNPRFYHDFMFGGKSATGSIFRDTIVIA